MTERTLNRTSVVELKASLNRTLSHVFTGIPNGAIYNVSVSTTMPGAQANEAVVYAPPLPAPMQLKVFPETNGSYVVFWKEVLDFKQEP